MSKAIIAVTAVVAALLASLLLAAPGVVGSSIEARVRERIGVIDASSTAAAELTWFDRGWFGSTAKLELNFLPDGFSPPLDDTRTGLVAGTLPVRVDFDHGPMAVLSGSWAKFVARLDTEAPGVVELERTLGVPYVFEFRGRTSFLGGVTFDADAPAFELPIDDTLISFAGATLDGTFADPRLAGNAGFASVSFTSPTGTFTVIGVRAAFDYALLSTYVMPGDATVSIERVEISEPLGGATPLFEAAGLNVTSDTTLDTTGELLDMRSDYTLESMRIDRSMVTDVAFGMELRNLDVAALEAYGAAMDDAAATASDTTELLATLAPQLERALHAAPSLTLDPIRFQLDAEPFDGRVTVLTNTGRLPPAGALDLESPLRLVGVFDGDAKLRLSKALAQRVTMLVAQTQVGNDASIPPEQVEYLAEAQAGLVLTMLIGQGVLVEDGDGYVTELELTNGALTLNGNALPFGLL